MIKKFAIIKILFQILFSSMSQWIQLPWIINQTNRTKFNLFNKDNKKLIKKAEDTKNQPKKNNPFLCLNKMAVINNSSVRNIKRTCTINGETCQSNNSTALPVLKLVQHKSLPPIQCSYSKGIIFYAFEQIKKYLINYQDIKTQQFQSQISNFRKIQQATFSQICFLLEKIKKKGIVFVDTLIGILTHSLEAEVRLKQQKWEQALYHFRKAEYYSRKISLMMFTIYCLVSESDIFRSCSKIQRGLCCLKKALNISIHINQTQIQLQILQKIGLFYYYSGNTHMGEYYHCLSNQGFSKQDIQRHKKQYKPQSQLQQLQQELLSFSNLLKSDQQPYANQQATPELKPIVKSKKKLRNDKQLSIMLLRQFKLSTVPQTNISDKQNMNCTQNTTNNSLVLKSHLSGNRRGLRGERQYQWKRLIELIHMCLTPVGQIITAS